MKTTNVLSKYHTYKNRQYRIRYHVYWLDHLGPSSFWYSYVPHRPNTKLLEHQLRGEYQPIHWEDEMEWKKYHLIGVINLAARLGSTVHKNEVRNQYVWVTYLPLPDEWVAMELKNLVRNYTDTQNWGYIPVIYLNILLEQNKWKWNLVKQHAFDNPNGDELDLKVYLKTQQHHLDDLIGGIEHEHTTEEY